LKTYVFIFLGLWHFLTFGQDDPTNLLRIKTIRVTQATIPIDTFSIQPYHFEVFQQDTLKISPDLYRVDFVKALLFLKDYQSLLNKEITVKYLVYPEYMRRTYQTYDWETVKQDSLQSIKILAGEKQESKPPFEGLKTRGSITRGVNAGNQQSLVMQSGLDLKIEGKLSDKLKVRAVLSDDNLPQAYAGISQSYKEFNRIYMQLEAPNWIATGGDLLMDEQPSYFLKFKRKSQGLSVHIGRDSSRVQVSGGFVQGQFGINRFNGIDGNQGPYTLKGNKGETYIFVVPESEKVYVNGKLLKKGADKDYIISYETAEIRFNPTFPITKNHRITVEFNYSNQHYVRYLNFNRYRHKNKHSQWSVYSFIEADAKTQTLLYDLNETQVQILKNAGDNLEALWVETAIPSTYNENKILYKKVTAGNSYYWEYTNRNEPDLYEVKFSYVGQNKGHYQIKQVIAIGKIYEYVGTNQGDYEPKIKLTPPANRKYFGFNWQYRPQEKTALEISGLLNHNDQNLFSSYDDHDNLGGAFHLKLRQNLWQKGQKSWNVTGQYDFTHHNFTALDPYRPVEFNRLWRIDSIYGRQDLADISVRYQDSTNFVTSGLRYFKLRDALQAGQIFVKSLWQNRKWQSDARYHYTLQSTEYELQSADMEHQITYLLPKYSLSATGHFEHRDKRQNKTLDSLNYRYMFGELKWQKRDTSRFAWQVFYKREQNDSIKIAAWQTTDITDNIGFALRQKSENTRIELFTGYRHTRLLNLNSQKDFLNIKLNWQQQYWQKFITTAVGIESFNGNTLRDEIVFVETPPGQGTHQWVDYNNNGIKEIDEFEVAVYSDQANYIRVILPSKNYIPTLNNAYKFQLTLNPAVWKKQTFLKKIYGVMLFENQHQSIHTNNWSPLVWQPAQILSQNLHWQQDWFYNRAGKRYHLHFAYQFVKQKQLLLAGTQQHLIETSRLQTKHAFKPYLIWKQQFEHRISGNNSENYTQKNYRLQTDMVEQGFEWQQKQKNKLYTYYTYKQKQNLSGDEKLKMHRVGLRYQYQNKGNMFNFDLQFVQNKMTGNLQSPVAFQMLEALQTGKNLVLQTLLKQRISSYLDLYLNYAFRLSETAPAVHTGGIQLKMVF